MTRSQLITKVANDTNMTSAEVEKVMDGIFGTIGDVLKSGDKVTIAGFGKFVAKYQKARDARNPKTGENIKVPARFSVKFSPSSILKNAVAK